MKQEEGFFQEQIGLKFLEVTIKVLHLDHTLSWC